MATRKKKTKPLWLIPLFSILLILGGAGYLYYTTFIRDAAPKTEPKPVALVEKSLRAAPLNAVEDVSVTPMSSEELVKQVEPWVNLVLKVFEKIAASVASILGLVLLTLNIRKTKRDLSAPAPSTNKK